MEDKRQKPAAGFSTAGPDAALLAEARRLLAERFGYEAFRPGQEESLRSVFSRRNLLAVMPTGSGKSLLYQLPALMDSSLTLVVSPLISLMKDQVDELTRRGMPATFVNSSLTLEEQRERLRLCTEGRVRLLYVAPERFRNEGFLAAVARIKVARMAVDEAHCISEWGHDFRPDYLRLKEFRRRIGMPLVTALTATATARVQGDIVEALGLAPGEVDVHVHGFDRPNLILSVRKVTSDEEKNRFISDFLKTEPGCGIVYVGTRRTADDLAEALKSVEPRTAVYHAGMEAEERTAAQERFLGGKARVVVATSAFGMGIDKPDVRFVIHYNYPGSVEQYYQEIGRAGRDGKTSRCILLHASADHFLREFFIDLNYPTRKEIESVYDVIMDLEENPIMLTYREIADLSDEDVKEGQVGATVRLLDAAGVTRASSGEQRIAVTLSRPAAEFLPKVTGPIQRRVLEALSFAADLEAPGRYEVSLGQLCVASGLAEEQVRRALTILDREGHIAYEPPFRGRGIEKTAAARVPFAKAPIDWKRHDARRAAETAKLDSIEQYITGPSCRREFILRYFGEREACRCGTCDRCAPEARVAGVGVLAQSPLAASAILVCVKHLRFSVGKGRIAQILAGSRDKELIKWGLDKNPSYGALRSRGDDVKRAIDELIREGYLDLGGEAGRPVVVLTDAGREAAEAAETAEATRAVGATGETTRAKREAKVPPREPAKRTVVPADARAAVLACVAALKPARGKGKVAELLTGSRVSWIDAVNAEALAFRGALNCTKDEAGAIIAGMVAEGLLAQGGTRQYPVLEVPQGMEGAVCVEIPVEDAADECETEDVTESPEPAADSPVAPCDALDHLITTVLDAEGEAAKGLVRGLDIYNAREVAMRLMELYDKADVRRRARIVWAVGEACGREGITFLASATISQDANVRRLAASALGKVLPVAVVEGLATAKAIELARRALERLIRDDVPQVRSYAESALKRLN